MNKWIEILVGLIVVVGVIFIAWASSTYDWTLFGKDFNFLNPAWVFLKGGIFWLLMLIGILLIFLGINDLKD
ncbi:hypothetical protein J4407_01030 [Candidatus Pacearchaeota archaeon]|nr:hypothetical protein [Candidatus Pacearchaeota archaeon]